MTYSEEVLHKSLVTCSGCSVGKFCLCSSQLSLADLYCQCQGYYYVGNRFRETYTYKVRLPFRRQSII
jgi:hypothetical protein